MAQSINYDEVKDFFEYNKDTGIVTWKKKPNQSIKVGKEVGRIGNDGYRTVGFNGKQYKVHRIVYCLVNKIIESTLYIDHIDRNKLNNKWNNLRIVDHETNCKNRNVRIDNTSGITGVDIHKKTGKYQVRININKKRKYLGLYDNLDDAIKIRKEAEDKYNYKINQTK